MCLVIIIVICIIIFILTGVSSDPNMPGRKPDGWAKYYDDVKRRRENYERMKEKEENDKWKGEKK
ncbi:MAG: hypothetical protein NTX00_00275 [Candidatus Parcubacteria bacterium]|nr:hypothetical protein [Candidatus Parcubacteria bacterium]